GGRMFDHHLHPVDQAPIPVWRYLPQRLLPPHDADDDAHQAVTDMVEGTLGRLCPPCQHGGCSTPQEQQPKDNCKPQLVGCDEESERVAYRVLSHAISRRGLSASVA